MNRSAEWWDKWFLDMAAYVATASKDPSTQVGAVIVDSERRIVSCGYNGFPKGIDDSEERLNDREKKYKIIIHAEENALLFANRPVDGCTLYTWPFMPCASCASKVIQKGIVKVVSLYNDNPRWIDNFNLSQELFAEKNVQVILLR